MNLPRMRRWLAALTVGLVGAWGAGPAARAGLRHNVDPAQVVPLAQIAPEARASVAEVIAEASFHRQGAPDTFPCNPKLYLTLLDEPALTLALWKDLSTSPATLQQIGPDRYQGADGAGTSATWQYVLRSPHLHVLLCELRYASPRGNARLEGRIVLIVRSDFFRDSHKDYWVKHDVEAYVKVDSKGWRTVAKTVKPLIEKLLEDQVQEAGWFVSLMGRLVETYPNWAVAVAQAGPGIRPEVRQGFRELVQATRKPGASPGRPQLADNAAAPPVRR